MERSCVVAHEARHRLRRMDCVEQDRNPGDKRRQIRLVRRVVCTDDVDAIVSSMPVGERADRRDRRAAESADEPIGWNGSRVEDF